MTYSEEDIIKKVIARIDDVSPGIASDISLGVTVKDLIVPTAVDYVLEFPVAKIPYFGEVTLVINNGKVFPPKDYIKPIRLILGKGNQYYTVEEFSPWLSPKATMARKGIYARESRPVVIDSRSQNGNADKTVLYIYPATFSTANLSYVKSFDPITYDDSDDKGFYDHYIWYLAHLTLVAMGTPIEIYKNIVANYITNL